MEILITGGTGFIGSALALRCLELGHDVSVLGLTNNALETRHASNLQAAGVNVLIGTVLDSDTLAGACAGKAAVIHLAAAQHESNVGNDYFNQINVEGTRNILEASVAAGVKRFVHGSTIGVYGSAGNSSLDENSPVHPDNIYGISKLEGERVAKSYCHRIALTIVRISETYGPGDKRLLTLFRGVKKGWFPVIGSGLNRHQPIYVADLVDYLVALLTTDKAASDTINLAGPSPVSTLDMILSVEHAFGKHIRTLRIPAAPLVGAALLMEKIMPPLGLSPPLTRRRLDFFRKEFAFNIEKATSVLGFSPAVDFSEGAQRTLAWYVNQGLL